HKEVAKIGRASHGLSPTQRVYQQLHATVILTAGQCWLTYIQESLLCSLCASGIHQNPCTRRLAWSEVELLVHHAIEVLCAPEIIRPGKDKVNLEKRHPNVARRAEGQGRRRDRGEARGVRAELLRRDQVALAPTEQGVTPMSTATLIDMPTEYRELVIDHFEDRSRDEVQRQIDECLKFLYIVSTTKGRFIPLTREVDEVWHEMIVQTKFYMDLCESPPGGCYIHHQSIGFSDYGERIGKREAVSQFLDWIPDYLENFGEFTSDTAKDWAVVQFIQQEFRLTDRKSTRLNSSHVSISYAVFCLKK